MATNYPVDPAVALKPFPISQAVAVTWPLLRVQYVIELVGPRTAASASVKPLLSKQWQDALGQPQSFVMASSDARWRRLDASDTSQAYDSVALAWDLISEKGTLSSAAAQQLLQTSEHLAQQISRRAMPLPIPADVDASVRTLSQIKDALDIGVNLSVVSRFGIGEEAIWKACSALGLAFGGQGEFEWRIDGWPHALLAVSPLGSHSAFSLAQVHSGATHDGVVIGFHVPLNPDPMRSLEACFRTAEYLAKTQGAYALDENDYPLTDATKAADRQNLQQALSAFTRVEMLPGSPEARLLFANESH